jgi:hypothetical protein
LKIEIRNFEKQAARANSAACFLFLEIQSGAANKFADYIADYSW